MEINKIKNFKYKLFLVLVLFLYLPLRVQAQDNTVILPGYMQRITEEAFARDNSITTLVVPKTVKEIGTRAFAECTSLSEVFLGKNTDLQIAKDAFSGCGRVHFYVYPETSGELYALSHGFECSLLEEGSPFLTRALDLIKSNGGTASILQSADFSSKRLIVQVQGNCLPDISKYDPIEIVRDGREIFFIQFSTVENAIDCYSFLKYDPTVIFVEVDSCVEILGDISAAGNVDGNVWDKEDPLGFEIYSPFVAENGSGKATIAVIDSGVSKKYGYLSILRADGINLTGDGEPWFLDSQSHGSMIAAIIEDCVGNANVDILPIRVVDKTGVASLTMIGVGIEYAVEHGADVINMSLNFEENAYVRYCIEKAMETGVEVIVAAGNSRKNIENVFPANLPGVITVSGIDNNYRLSATSNYGENVSFCAPDTYVMASSFSGIIRRGTSFAVPMIASAIALEKLDNNHDRDDLIASCRDLGIPQKDIYYGYGLPQLEKLVYPDVESISIIAGDRTLSGDDIIELQPGDALRLSAQITPDNAVNTVTWSVKSEPSGVITIDSNGNLKAIKAGTAFVTAASTVNPAVKNEVEVIVQVMPTKISIIGSDDVEVGSSIILTADVEPSDTTNKSIVWSCSNEKATVSPEGIVTGVSSGEVEIIATSESDTSISARKLIIVKQLPVNISISGINNIYINNDVPEHVTQNTSLLTAKVGPEDAYNKSVNWSSSDPSVATVNEEGIVTTVAPGSTIITATSEADSRIQDSITVNVKNLWTEWTRWTDSVVSGTDSRQVRIKNQYRSNTKNLRYGDWGNWSDWTINRESTSNLKQEESSTVWYWYNYLCPYCGTHMHLYTSCYTWAGGCGNYIGAENARVCWLPVSASGGEQNWKGTGKIMYGNNERDRWFYWKDSANPNGSSTTGYRYRTRSSWWDESGWSAWQDQPIVQVNNNDYKVEIEMKTQYSYRDKNMF